MFKIEITGNSIQELKDNLTEVVKVYFPTPSSTSFSGEQKPPEANVGIGQIQTASTPWTPQPVYPQQQIQQPVPQPQQIAPPAVPIQQAPVAVPTYGLDQLAVAATGLVDAGRLGELQNILTAFGIQAMTQLPKEQYGNFATALRGLGVAI